MASSKPGSLHGRRDFLEQSGMAAAGSGDRRVARRSIGVGGRRAHQAGRRRSPEDRPQCLLLRGSPHGKPEGPQQGVGPLSTLRLLRGAGIRGRGPDGLLLSRLSRGAGRQLPVRHQAPRVRPRPRHQRHRSAQRFHLGRRGGEVRGGAARQGVDRGRGKAGRSGGPGLRRLTAPLQELAGGFAERLARQRGGLGRRCRPRVRGAWAEVRSDRRRAESRRLRHDRSGAPRAARDG